MKLIVLFLTLQKDFRKIIRLYNGEIKNEKFVFKVKHILKLGNYNT